MMYCTSQVILEITYFHINFENCESERCLSQFLFFKKKKIPNLFPNLYLRVRFTLRNEDKLGKKTFMHNNVFVYPLGSWVFPCI